MTDEGVPPPEKANQANRNDQALASVYQKTLETFPEAIRAQKSALIESAFANLRGRLASTEEFVINDHREAILKLKIARHFQTSETIDLNTLYDALVETPKFIDTAKGSLFRLLEIHQEKTLIKIAEMRKKRAEMGADVAFNPYENLLTTASGDYHLVRLLNMPHLEDESAYMRHCVGTSDSYINRMKHGDIEIFSFRRAPKLNPKTEKLEGDTPIITIEYDVRAKRIEQIKKAGDEYLRPKDSYFNDVIDALKQLRASRTDAGEPRTFSINPNELENIKVRDHHILTDRGEVHFRDFDPNGDEFIFKLGRMEITPRTSKKDAAKMLKIVAGADCEPEEIALGESDLQKMRTTGVTIRAYIGSLSPGMFAQIPSSTEFVYESFPEEKIEQYPLAVGGIPKETLIDRMREKYGKDSVTTYAVNVMENPDFTIGAPETLSLVELSVAALGFKNGATTREIFERAASLGLELCPPDTGPHLRLTRDPDLVFIGMKPITDRDGSPRVFLVRRREDGTRWLHGYWAPPEYRWGPDYRFVFRKSVLGPSKP